MSQVLARKGEISLEDIAKEMGTSKSNVNKLLRSALKKLRDQGAELEMMRELAIDLDRSRKEVVEWS